MLALGLALGVLLQPRVALPSSVWLLEAHVAGRPAGFTEKAELICKGWPGCKLAGSGPGTSVLPVEPILGRYPGSAEDGRITEFKQRFEAGFDQYWNGRLKAAKAELGKLVQEMLANSAARVKHQTARETFLRALAVLVHTNIQLRDDNEAKAVMLELLRSFPDQPVVKQGGPDVEDLRKYVIHEQRKRKRGSLLIKAESDASLFVNEQFVGVGQITLENLYPGTYRVMCLHGSRMGRVYDVPLRDGEAVERTYSLTLDLVVSAAEQAGVVGFLFPNAQDRARFVVPFAVTVGKRMGVPAVAVAEPGMAGGEGAKVTLVDVATGKSRQATVSMGPGGVLGITEALAVLGGAAPAEAQAGETPPAPPTQAANLRPPPPTENPSALHPTTLGVAGADEPGVPVGEVRTSPSTFKRVMPWLTLSLGLAATGIGAYLLSTNGQGDCPATPCAELRDTTAVGYTSIGLGGALIATSIFMFSSGWAF